MNPTDRKNIPNLLTLLRLVLAAGFFAVLGVYRIDAGLAWLLPIAIGLFIVAAVTDGLDGHLARKWRVESTFGRIMDPFCDKVLILGAFICLAGPGFTWIVTCAEGPLDVSQVTGVYPWMVIVILARELLVTAVRGELEGMGIRFGANWAGKAKMILQSIVVPVVLAIVFVIDAALIEDRAVTRTLQRIGTGGVYLTVLATVISGLPYITGAKKALDAADPT